MSTTKHTPKVVKDMVARLKLQSRIDSLREFTRSQQSHIDCLKAEKAELVDIIQRFVNWDIRLSEPVTEGIDRDIIKDAQAAISKAEPS